MLVPLLPKKHLGTELWSSWPADGVHGPSGRPEELHFKGTLSKGQIDCELMLSKPSQEKRSCIDLDALPEDVKMSANDSRPENLLKLALFFEQTVQPVWHTREPKEP